MQFVNKITLFQTDRENEVLKLDKLWHATHFRCLSEYYIWFLFFLIVQEKFWPPFKISNFNRLQQLFFFFYLAFCSAAVICFNSMKATNHKNRTGTNPPAVFFSLTNMFFRPPLLALSRMSPGILGRHTLVMVCAAFWCIWLALFQLWSIERTQSVPQGQKTLAARTLIHTVKLN